jgi:hypothetical protein
MQASWNYRKAQAKPEEKGQEVKELEQQQQQLNQNNLEVCHSHKD